MLLFSPCETEIVLSMNQGAIPYSLITTISCCISAVLFFFVESWLSEYVEMFVCDLIEVVAMSPPFLTSSRPAD